MSSRSIPPAPTEWLKAVDDAIAADESLPLTIVRPAHELWWEKFWNRSWIHVTTGGTAPGGTSASDRTLTGLNGRPTEDDAFVVSRAYALQRFITACAGRGAYPIKFNGSLFTVPVSATARGRRLPPLGSRLLVAEHAPALLSACAPPATST